VASCGTTTLPIWCPAASIDGPTLSGAAGLYSYRAAGSEVFVDTLPVNRQRRRAADRAALAGTSLQRCGTKGMEAQAPPPVLAVTWRSTRVATAKGRAAKRRAAEPTASPARARLAACTVAAGSLSSRRITPGGGGGSPPLAGRQYRARVAGTSRVLGQGLRRCDEARRSRWLLRL
jgi:hypothetical protein